VKIYPDIGADIARFGVSTSRFRKGFTNDSAALRKRITPSL